MCIFSSPPSNGANAARDAEIARENRISQGSSDINKTFSQFDDNYYNGVAKASNDYYMPQVDKQYDEARRSLVLNLARSGTLNGSAGAHDLGLLDTQYQTDKSDYANQGIAAENQQRTAVEGARSDLMNQLNASADPVAAGAAAVARAKTLSGAPVFSPIGNLFGQFLQQGAFNVAANSPGYGAPYGVSGGIYLPGAPSGGGGSSTIVR